MQSPGPYQIEILPRQDILNYMVSGYISTEDDFHRFIREVTAIITRSGHHKVLADIRSLAGLRPGVMGAIKVVEESFSPALRDKRIAIIERVENIISMMHREAVASNRGYTLKYFTRSNEAEAWLR